MSYWNREDLAWAAGLFEGEGTISTRHTLRKCSGKRDRSLIAKIKMADEDVLRRFHVIVGIGNVRGPYKSDGQGSKPLWDWQVGSFEGVQAIIALLWNWLSSRRRARIVELLKEYHLAGKEIEKYYKRKLR